MHALGQPIENTKCEKGKKNREIHGTEHCEQQKKPETGFEICLNSKSQILT